jgi:Tfp pilus assembly protein PilW
MRQPINTIAFSCQRGMSLVSLMVGLLLAMIGILAGMTLYKNIVQTSIQTRNDALQDGQLASAMLTLQLELQNAGFGITPGGAVPHVVRSGNTLYWRYAVNNVTQCKGFQIQDLDNNTRRELQILKTRDGTTCNTTDALTTFQWELASAVASFRDSEAADVDLPVITLDLVNGQCFPYGMGTAAAHPVVTVVADNAAISAAKKVGTTPPNTPFRYDFCLSNI